MGGCWGRPRSFPQFGREPLRELRRPLHEFKAVAFVRQAIKDATLLKNQKAIEVRFRVNLSNTQRPILP